MFDDLIGGNRWRPIAAAVAVIAAGTIAFFTVAGGSASRNLPAPPHVSSAAGSSHSNSTPTTLGATFTPVESANLTSCSVSVSNPRPPQSATGETVGVQSAAGAQVKLEADYARTHSVHTLSADSTGKATFSLPIDHASPGVTVPVKATASLGKTKVNCSASFTPVGTVSALPALQPLTTFVKVTKLLPGAPTLAQLPPLPPPPAGQPPATTSPTTPPGTQPLPPPPPTTTAPPLPTTTTTTVPPTTTTTTPPTTTTTTPPTTTTTTTTPPTTTTTTTVPPTTTTTTVPPTTTTTTVTIPITLPL